MHGRINYDGRFYEKHLAKYLLIPSEKNVFILLGNLFSDLLIK